MEKAAKCPFCGGKPSIYKQKDSEAFGPGFAQVYCPKCNVTQIGKQYHTEKEAIEAWNRRT